MNIAPALPPALRGLLVNALAEVLLADLQNVPTVTVIAMQPEAEVIEISEAMR